MLLSTGVLTLLSRLGGGSFLRRFRSLRPRRSLAVSLGSIFTLFCGDAGASTFPVGSLGSCLIELDCGDDGLLREEARLLLFTDKANAFLRDLLRALLLLFLRSAELDSAGKFVSSLSFEKAGDLAARSYDKAAATSVLNCPRYLPLGPIRTSNLPFLVSCLTPKKRGCGVLDLSMGPLLDFLDLLVAEAGLVGPLFDVVSFVGILSDVLLDSWIFVLCERGLDLALGERGVRGVRSLELGCDAEDACSVARVVRLRRLVLPPVTCCFWE